KGGRPQDPPRRLDQTSISVPHPFRVLCEMGGKPKNSPGHLGGMSTLGSPSISRLVRNGWETISLRRYPILLCGYHIHRAPFAPRAGTLTPDPRPQTLDPDRLN